jgi:hypothetical protein
MELKEQLKKKLIKEILGFNVDAKQKIENSSNGFDINIGSPLGSIQQAPTVNDVFDGSQQPKYAVS